MKNKEKNLIIILGVLCITLVIIAVVIVAKVYQNKITKKINNNKTVCYLKEEKELFNPIEIPTIKDKIEKVFSGYGYAYNIPVTIKTSSQTYETSLIAKTSNNIITLDNNIIPISDIIDFKINKN